MSPVLFMRKTAGRVFAISIFGCQMATASPPAEPSGYGELLARYVSEDGLVAYEAWARDARDVDRLRAHVDELERRAGSSGAPPDPAAAAPLATWIDLYNAATLELVLDAHPIASLRDVPGPDGSPWKRNVVAVDGDSLSLDEIEHGIIRPRFADARVHFSLNCASLGCPPLEREPFEGAALDDRLDRATRRAITDTRWVHVDGDRVTLSKIFEWFEEDFTASAGSVTAFLSSHGVELPPEPVIAYADYDWRLNEAPER